MILVSACLVGINCRYDGKASTDEKLVKLIEEGKAISVCPEVLGGLPIPRTPCEIKKINGEIAVISAKGKDCTNEFILGAKRALEIAKENNCKIAIMKSKSPSCGCGKVYSGRFDRVLIDGDGLTVTLLKEDKIEIYNEKTYSERIGI